MATTVSQSTMEIGGVLHIILLMVFIQSKPFTKLENSPLLDQCPGAMVYINEKDKLELKNIPGLLTEAFKNSYCSSRLFMYISHIARYTVNLNTHYLSFLYSLSFQLMLRFHAVSRQRQNALSMHCISAVKMSFVGNLYLANRITNKIHFCAHILDIPNMWYTGNTSFYYYCIIEPVQNNKKISSIIFPTNMYCCRKMFAYQ